MKIRKIFSCCKLCIKCNPEDEDDDNDDDGRDDIDATFKEYENDNGDEGDDEDIRAGRDQPVLLTNSEESVSEERIGLGYCKILFAKNNFFLR